MLVSKKLLGQKVIGYDPGIGERIEGTIVDIGYTLPNPSGRHTRWVTTDQMECLYEHEITHVNGKPVGGK